MEMIPFGRVAKRSSRRSTTVLRMFTAIAMLTFLSGSPAAPPPDEYQVKAVFLFNFTQFVDWPPQSFADGRAPFVIGVLGRDPFGGRLDQAVQGESVQGRPLVIERYRTRADLKRCQILFIDRSASADLEAVLNGLERTGTLTVTDFEAAAAGEVMIRFFTQDQKIRLRINVDSVRGAGLTISSKLLRPAEVVGRTGEG